MERKKMSIIYKYDSPLVSFWLVIPRGLYTELIYISSFFLPQRTKFPFPFFSAPTRKPPIFKAPREFKLLEEKEEKEGEGRETFSPFESWFKWNVNGTFHLFLENDKSSSHN